MFRGKQYSQINQLLFIHNKSTKIIQLTNRQMLKLMHYYSQIHEI